MSINLKKFGRIYSGLKYRNLKWVFDIFFSNYIYIPDSLFKKALEFKTFFDDEDSLNNLVKGLDIGSELLIYKYKMAVNYVVNNHDLCISRKLLNISENPTYGKIRNNIEEYCKEFVFPHKKLGEVFFYKHGLIQIPGFKERMNGKDVIDCGAYFGDSALMFSKELNLSKIYSLEPDPYNFKKLKETVEKNKKDKQIFPINIGVGKEKCVLKFDSGKFGGSGINSGGNISVKIDCIDNIVRDFNINPGLIKWDIEGLEYDSLSGSKKAIERYKPILLISVYHTPIDFFKIKPLLEKWNLGYKFKFVHCEMGCNFSEIMLLAY